MSMTANLHGASKAIANRSNGAEWLQIVSSSGDFVCVFMPFAKAQAMADAFNAPTTRPVTLPDFSEAAQ